MKNGEEKADFLITLVGTSAMPNLIGIATRIKPCGKIFLIHTSETKDISDSLEEFIEQKNDMEEKFEVKSNSIELENYDNPEEVYGDLLKKFKKIYKKINESRVDSPLVELNYTGGTKVISSLSCVIFNKVFKDFNGNIYLTYLDGEKSEIHIFKPNLNEEYIIQYLNEDGTIPLTASDIVNVHMKSGFFRNNNEKDDFNQSKFSKDMYECICKNIDKRDKIIHYLDELHDKLNKIKSRELIEFLDEFLIKNKLLEGYDSSIDFIKAFYEDYTEKDQLSNGKTKKISKIVSGIWFEEVIHKILLELKQENVIDNFENNLSKRKNGDDLFEIDFIAVKDYKLYYISVSTADTVELSAVKLYEAKQRAKIISDSESAVASITFVEDKNELVNRYKYVWEENPKNVLITTWNDLPELKDKIKEWILVKGDVQ